MVAPLAKTSCLIYGDKWLISAYRNLQLNQADENGPFFHTLFL